MYNLPSFQLNTPVCGTPIQLFRLISLNVFTLARFRAERMYYLGTESCTGLNFRPGPGSGPSTKARARPGPARGLSTEARARPGPANQDPWPGPQVKICGPSEEYLEFDIHRNFIRFRNSITGNFHCL